MTNAELAAKLLREAASLYRLLGGGKDLETAERVEKFGALYERVADRIERDPEGSVEADLVE